MATFTRGVQAENIKPGSIFVTKNSTSILVGKTLSVLAPQELVFIVNEIDEIDKKRRRSKYKKTFYKSWLALVKGKLCILNIYVYDNIAPDFIEISEYGALLWLDSTK